MKSYRLGAAALLAAITFAGTALAAPAPMLRPTTVITPVNTPQNSPVMVHTAGKNGTFLIAGRDWSGWDPDGFKASWFYTFAWRQDMGKWLSSALPRPDITMNASEPDLTTDAAGNSSMAALVVSEIRPENIMVWTTKGDSLRWLGPNPVWKLPGGYAIEDDVKILAGQAKAGQTAPIYVFWSGINVKGSVVQAAISTDGGKTFAKPLNLVKGTNADPVSTARPVLAPDGTIYVFYRYGQPVKDTPAPGGVGCLIFPGGDLTKGQDVRPTEMLAPHGVVGYLDAIVTSGGIMAAWTDSDGHGKHGSSLYVNGSPDGGKTWTKSVQITAPQAQPTNWYELPALSALGQRVGVIFQMTHNWRTNNQSTYDVYLAQSTDGGKTFPQATRLSTQTSNPLNEQMWGKGYAFVGVNVTLVLSSTGYEAAWTDITTSNEVIVVQSGQ